MHVRKNVKQKLTSFTYTSWSKFVSFAAKWRKLSCNKGETALKAASKLCLKLDDSLDIVSFAETPRSPGSYLPIPTYCKFHRECYCHNMSQRLGIPWLRPLTRIVVSVRVIRWRTY